MQKQKNRSKRLRSLIVISALTAVILSVSTYAWFIGMQAVNVTSFDVEIEVTDSLLLSFDGERWSPELTISETTLNQESYAGHTNNWGDLIPMSTIGEMDVTASRMKLFEKASFTPTPGGYRLLASRVDNNLELDQPEPNGYVVFDLFIRNFSGREYYTALNELDEEAIYLTTDSEVIVAADGVADTGIENSVRVAFAQIGRVIGTTMDDEVITGIDCAIEAESNPAVPGYDGTSVTGICRTAQIWEPNDDVHVAAALSWYDTSCLSRSGATVNEENAYGPEACNTLNGTTAYSTYAVKEEIDAVDHVDVYDGAEYNNYEGTTELQEMDYFTDTEKNLEGVDRPAFMYLAPNSITKVRVYVYIEGQDIDNYDFSSIGKKISIKFGFTKERFVDEDIDYTLDGGPTIDLDRPVITLEGDNPLQLRTSDEYVEPGFTATDPQDGEIDDEEVIITSNVVEGTPGTYRVTYSVEDSSGNKSALVTRYVVVSE